MSFPCSFALQFSDKFEDAAAGRIRLLLVDLGGDDAGILNPPIVDDATALSNCTVFPISQIAIALSQANQPLHDCQTDNQDK